MEARPVLTGAFTLAAICAALIAAPAAGATTYNNDTPINIGISAGPANPYPSSITVSGTAGPITDVNLGLDDFTHTAPTDVHIALVAPTGHALRFQCGAGSNIDVAGVDLTFDDASAFDLPELSALQTGTFQPTSHCAFMHSFPPPGPSVSYGNAGPGGSATFASVFNGISAIGTWNLYVADLTATDSGSIPGGWSLDVKPDVTPPPPAAPTPTVTPTPTITPTPTPAPTKKCKKKKKRGGKAGASACKKKKKK